MQYFIQQCCLLFHWNKNWKTFSRSFYSFEKIIINFAKVMMWRKIIKEEMLGELSHWELLGVSHRTITSHSWLYVLHGWGMRSMTGLLVSIQRKVSSTGSCTIGWLFVIPEAQANLDNALPFYLQCESISWTQIICP